MQDLLQYIRYQTLLLEGVPYQNALLYMEYEHGLTPKKTREYIESFKIGGIVRDVNGTLTLDKANFDKYMKWVNKQPVELDDLIKGIDALPLEGLDPLVTDELTEIQARLSTIRDDLLFTQKGDVPGIQDETLPREASEETLELKKKKRRPSYLA